MDLEVIAMKEYSTFARATNLEPRHQLQFSAISGHSLGESYHSAEMQSVYSAVQAETALIKI